MTDLDIIKQIEKELNIKLEKLDKIEWGSRGYTLNQNGQVTGLGLFGCKINNLNRIISPLKELINLMTLDLRDKQLSDISPLKDLMNLTTLRLNRNKIIDISPLKELTKLTSLDLRANQLRDISPLNKLTKLTSLDLAANKLNDISPLKELTNLTKLDLGFNPIEELPSWVTDFKTEFKWSSGGSSDGYFYFDNPLKIPPVEIVKQGKEAVKSYFEQLEKQGKDNIYEAKLMLVGEPGSGKTTLMNLLFDKDFPVPNKKQKSTLGIEVRQNWGFSIDDKKDFKAHIWDFGGQQIQYMLHQFFLTSDCLYVLMAEKRRELANFDYWLNIINILGKNSPVVTLFNEINIETIASFIYDEKKYKNLFPELSLQRLDVNLADIGDGRFDTLLHIIKKQLSKLELVGKEVPARWVDIRKELEKRRAKKHIHINEYFEICKKFDIEKEADQMLILRYFHLLGIVLHFCEDENLCDTLFLDPNWTVDAIYSVLANKEIEKSNGFIKKSDIDKIWSDKGYEFEERAKLLQLMLKDKFELCYKLPGAQDNYIVPLLLSPQKPEYDWDNKDNLQFRFQYPFMPKGIVSRLIVRMHEYIHQNMVWNEGVLFKKNGAMAQVIEQKTVKEGLKIIEIRLKGTPNSRKDLLTLIREEIKKIQNNSFPNLPYVEMVPCNCKECINETNPYFFDYGDIETYLQKGKTEIDCRKSTEQVSIADLVGSVFNLEEIKSRYKKMMDDNKINIHFSDFGKAQVTSDIKANLTSTQQQTITVHQEVKNVQGLFKNLKEDILDEIETEIDDDKEKQRIKNELQKAENAFNELEKAASEGKKEIDAGTKSRIGEFIDNLSDENSRINKALKLVSKGADKVQKLGRFYNKVAPYFALPSIPPILLGKEKKD
jgi:internalin A